MPLFDIIMIFLCTKCADKWIECPTVFKEFQKLLMRLNFPLFEIDMYTKHF